MSKRALKLARKMAAADPGFIAKGSSAGVAEYLPTAIAVTEIRKLCKQVVANNVRIEENVAKFVALSDPSAPSHVPGDDEIRATVQRSMSKSFTREYFGEPFPMTTINGHGPVVDIPDAPPAEWS